MRKGTIGLFLAAGLMTILFVSGAATAGGDTLAGTWHERDGGRSNLFWFVDEPVGGVYPVLYYDDETNGPVCGDGGPMLWSGFATATEPNTIEGTFGHYWCPDTGDGEIAEQFWDVIPENVGFFITHFPETDTITSIGGCVGTRQPHIKNVAKAIHELDKGMFPEPGPDIGCEG